MKKILRYWGSLSVILLVLFSISCDILTPLDPELKTEKEAWDVIIEAHAMKQLWFHNFFRTYSNNYSRGQLFIYEPTKAQLDLLIEEFNELMTYTAAVEAAVDTIDAMANDLSKTPLAKSTARAGLLSALKDFFSAGSEVNENNRKRIIMIASNMSQADRDQLYDELVIGKWQRDIGTSSEFWAKLQNGDLDDKASTLYKNFYDGANSLLNPFTGLANDKNLTPGKMLAKDGMNLCNKGMDVVLETGKTIVPGLGQATDILDAGKDYYEKAEKMVDKPMEFLSDEIKSRGAAYVAGIIDIDSKLDSEGAGKYVKTIAELTLGSDDPQELIEKGIDAGIARIKSTDNSIKTDIVIAENKQPGAGLPDYIFGIGTYAQEANEFILNLPSGNWGITAKDNIGYSSTPVTVAVVTQQESTVDVVASDTSSTGTPTDTTIVQDPRTKRLEEVLDSLNVMPYRNQRIRINLVDYTDEGYYVNHTFYNSSIFYTHALIFAPQWTNYSFSCNYDQDSIHTGVNANKDPALYKGSTEINGSIFLDTTQSPMISISAHQLYYEYYGTTENALRSKEEIQIEIDSLPLTTNIGNYGEYFDFSNWFDNAINGLPVKNCSHYSSAQIDEFSYDSSGTTTWERHHSYFNDPENGHMTVTFSFIDTATSSITILTDY